MCYIPCPSCLCPSILLHSSINPPPCLFLCASLSPPSPVSNLSYFHQSPFVSTDIVYRPTSSTSCLSDRPLSVTTFLIPPPPPLFIDVHCFSSFPRLTDGDIQQYLITLIRVHLFTSVRLRLSTFLLPPLVAFLHYIHTYIQVYLYLLKGL